MGHNQSGDPVSKLVSGSWASGSWTCPGENASGRESSSSSSHFHGNSSLKPQRGCSSSPPRPPGWKPMRTSGCQAAHEQQQDKLIQVKGTKIKNAMSTGHRIVLCRKLPKWLGSLLMPHKRTPLFNPPTSLILAESKGQEVCGTPRRTHTQVSVVLISSFSLLDWPAKAEGCWRDRTHSPAGNEHGLLRAVVCDAGCSTHGLPHGPSSPIALVAWN